MDHELKNDRIGLRWNDAGDLTGMVNFQTGRELINAHILCRLVLGSPCFLEFEACPAGLEYVEIRTGSLIFHYSKVVGEDGNEYPVGVDLQITLSGDEIHWGISVKNGTDEVTVREIHYPVLSIREPDAPLKVHTSELVSTTYQDLPAMLRGCFSNYMAPDQKYIRHTSFYPGRTSSLNFYLLDYGTEILYFGCHDPEFLLTGHSFEIEKNRNINCFMARMPFLKPHEEMAENRIVTSLMAESWPAGVRKYRQWADSWFKPMPQSPWIRDSFGWQRIIMHHQYGEYFFRYADLPRILDSGLPSGIDTIFLFGWTMEGMDSGYPQYTPDPACGGFDELHRNILKISENGGHVIIYYNGQLIDAASDYYRGGAGQRVSIKRADGTEHREFYNFSNTGIFTRIFGNKTFAVACPSCREWRDILKRHIDLAYELGADGVFFDQLGLASYPCCDHSHGHPVPFTGLMQSKRDLCRELCEYAKSKDPDFAIGVECSTDQTAQYCDFIHIFGHTAQVRNPDFQRKEERPILQCEAPLFSMAFPEIYLSDREIRDDTNVEFRVNQLLFQQRRSDVEIYRCRADLSAAPQYGAYLKQVNDLRSRFQEILLHGEMTAGEGVSCSDPLVLLNTFRRGDALAVVVSQSSKERITAELSVPGYEMQDFASARNDAVVHGKTVTLPRHSLAVLFYRRTGK